MSGDQECSDEEEFLLANFGSNDDRIKNEVAKDTQPARVYRPYVDPRFKFKTDPFHQPVVQVYTNALSSDDEEELLIEDSEVELEEDTGALSSGHSVKQPDAVN